MFAIYIDKKYVSPHFDNWEDMYFNMFDGEVFDEEVWEHIRNFSFSDAPQMETVYQYFLLSNLSSLIRDFIIKKIPELANNFDDWYDIDFDNGSPSYADLFLEVRNFFELNGDEKRLDYYRFDIENKKDLLLLVRKLKSIHQTIKVSA